MIDDNPSRREVWRMFDRIAGRYDFLNHFLSAGQDIRWRKKVARFLPQKDKIHLLDLATGTGDQAISLTQNVPRIEKSVGMDLSEKMLEVGRRKVVNKQLSERIELIHGDATDIPADDNSFDTVTISFGIRNVTDVLVSLKEMLRVLRPGGKAIILEFSLPGNRLLRQAYLFYFRHILPRLGGLISGDNSAYLYLNKTVETFPYAQSFCDLMTKAGFEHAEFKTLTFGIASIYHAVKPEPSGVAS